MNPKLHDNTFFDIIGVSAKTVASQMPSGVAIDKQGVGFSSPNMRSGLLCTARSGSSLLAVGMQAYGFQFEEYLNRNGRLAHIIRKDGVTSLPEMAAAVEITSTIDGRLSTKIPPAVLPYLFLMGEFPKNLDKWRFIYLERENIIRQAISSVIAKRTGLWTSSMTAQGEISNEDYSFSEILSVINNIGNSNRLLKRFIGLFDIQVRTVVYEDFVKDQKGQALDIARFLGANPSEYPEASKFEPWIKRQASDLNDEWEQRFRNDLVNFATPQPA